MPVRNTISATDITNCLRGVVFKKQKIIAPELHPEIQKTLSFFSTLADLGKQIEAEVINFWRKKNCLISPGDFIPNESYGFTGRFDAICKINGKTILFEIKGAGRHFFGLVNQTKESRSYHKIQTMIYHHSLLDKYPDLNAHILYISRDEFKRGNLKSVDIPIDYTENDFITVKNRADLVQKALEGGELPPAVPAIEFNSETNNEDISINAITCRHHALCLSDDDWYIHALEKLGRSS